MKCLSKPNSIALLDFWQYMAVRSLYTRLLSWLAKIVSFRLSKCHAKTYTSNQQVAWFFIMMTSQHKKMDCRCFFQVQRPSLLLALYIFFASSWNPHVSSYSSEHFSFGVPLVLPFSKNFPKKVGGAEGAIWGTYGCSGTGAWVQRLGLSWTFKVLTLEFC